jgi:hypothetical protein
VSTTAVRIQEELLTDVKRIAAIRGETPGKLLAQAWVEFIERHRAEIAEQFGEVARMFRDGDSEGLAELSKQTRRARAEAAASAAQA